MGKIVISSNLSLDGVVQLPTAAGDALGRGDWSTRLAGRDREEWARHEYEEAVGAGALLMGRRTYAWFVERGWATRTGAWADRLRDLPKYVVSSAALAEPAWAGCTVLGGDVPKEVAALRGRVEGDIVVYGSGRLVHTLIEHDLVDELRLMAYPLVIGAGDRLFGATGAVKSLRLTGTRTVGDGLALLTYRSVRDTGEE
ncbi:Dihydrofolate reductase [Actinacidiphila yanglinensis]|uniref:Dihydrofolate reductase n=1 Tax=Actinacidiphila yanglinensis TaxID=310779 RepID=A0A1H6D5Z2_9ACTN|nr:dihydrofolate reductase family protein [Actinacidiphila yanglinensis]SEG80799.1 Dihydrofolate reductase [Actinacidiphila yanglinensis]